MDHEIKRRSHAIACCGRMLCGLLAFLGTLAALGSRAYAIVPPTVKNTTTGSTYESVNKAFEEATKGDVLVLQKDAELSSFIMTSTEDLTFDLNGYSLNLNQNNILNGGDLSIINSAKTDRYHYFNAGWTLAENLSDEQKDAVRDLDDLEMLTAADGVFKIKGSILYNGSAVTGLGGAVVNTAFSTDKAGNLVVENVAFANCRATDMSAVQAGAGLGGAIDNEGASVTLKNVRAYGCGAQNGGFFYNSFGKTATIENTTVKFCSAAIGGGAVCNYGTCVAAGLEIYGCGASIVGGGIFNQSAAMDLFPATLVLRDSLISGCVGTAGGGGIYNCDDMTVENSIIKNCVSGSIGGGIVHDGAFSKNGLGAEAAFSKITISGCSSTHESWNESVYVKNAFLRMQSGTIENMIFTNDNTENGDPACDVVIYAGDFTNYVPKAEHIDADSYLTQSGDLCRVRVRKGLESVSVNSVSANSVSANTVSGNAIFTYDGTPKALQLTDSESGEVLAVGEHYSVSYNGILPTVYEEQEQAPVHAGKYKARVTMTGAYKGEFDYAFIIEKAAQPDHTPPRVMDQVSYDVTRVGDVALPQNWSWRQMDVELPLTAGVSVDAVAEYTGEDRDDYVTTQVQISITRAEKSGGDEGTDKDKDKDKDKDQNKDREGSGNKDTDKPAPGGNKVTPKEDKKPAPEEKKPTPEAPQLPKVGESITADTKDGAVYKVTGTDEKNRTVAYCGNPGKKQKTVTIPKTIRSGGVKYKVTAIAANAFKNDQTVEKIVIPDTVQKIGANAFKKAKRLRIIRIKSKKLKAKNISKKAFKGLGKKVIIRVPKKKVKAYRAMLRGKGLSRKVQVKAL